MGFPGWSLADIKSMTVRERTYWQSVVNWRRERSG